MFVLHIQDLWTITLNSLSSGGLLILGSSLFGSCRYCSPPLLSLLCPYPSLAFHSCPLLSAAFTVLFLPHASSHLPATSPLFLPTRTFVSPLFAASPSLITLLTLSGPLSSVTLNRRMTCSVSFIRHDLHSFASPCNSSESPAWLSSLTETLSESLHLKSWSATISIAYFLSTASVPLQYHLSSPKSFRDSLSFLCSTSVVVSFLTATQSFLFESGSLSETFLWAIATVTECSCCCRRSVLTFWLSSMPALLTTVLCSFLKSHLRLMGGIGQASITSPQRWVQNLKVKVSTLY